MIDIWIKVNNIGFYSACENRAYYCEIARNTKRFIYVLYACLLWIIVIVENICSAEGTFSIQQTTFKWQDHVAS
jgi:hypothetical protein